jgi:hypothetical protein
VIIFATALLIPFEQLIALADALTLAIFAAVEIALWRVQRCMPQIRNQCSIGRFVPPLAAALTLLLMLAELIT